MKSAHLVPALVMSVVIVILASCSKTGGNAATANNNTTTDSVSNFLTSGKWTIGSMSQKNEDNTSSFTGYVFSFEKNGQLTAVKNGTSVQGAWHYTPAVTYYGSSSSNAISIDLGTDNPFSRLTRTWNLLTASANTIKLQNPEIQEQEQVQFIKQ